MLKSGQMLKSGESEQKACGSSLSYSWNSSLSIIISKWSKKKKINGKGKRKSVSAFACPKAFWWIICVTSEYLYVILLDPNSLGEVLSAKAWTLQWATTCVTKLLCEPGRHWIGLSIYCSWSLTKWVEISCWLLGFCFNSGFKGTYFRHGINIFNVLYF